MIGSWSRSPVSRAADNRDHERSRASTLPPTDQPNSAGVRTTPVQPGLTFHGFRHSHKTWLIADDLPEIAQARRLGRHLDNRVVETYSHVAPEVEHRLLHHLELRWHAAVAASTDESGLARATAAKRVA
jgi:integrase